MFKNFNAANFTLAFQAILSLIITIACAVGFANTSLSVADRTIYGSNALTVLGLWMRSPSERRADSEESKRPVVFNQVEGVQENKSD